MTDSLAKLALIVAIVFTVSACEWDLEETFFPNFDNSTPPGRLSDLNIADRAVYEDPEDGTIYIGGISDEGLARLIIFDKEGRFSTERILDTTGIVSSIALGREDDELVLLIQDSVNSYIVGYDINSSSTTEINNDIFTAFAADPGFLGAVQLRTITKLDTGYLAAGQLRQVIGSPQVALIVLTDSLTIKDEFNFIANVSISELAEFENDYIVAGLHNSTGEVYFYRINSAGAQQWQRRIPSQGNSIGDFFIVPDEGKLYYAQNREDSDNFKEEIRTIILPNGDREILTSSEETTASPAKLAISPFNDIDGESTILTAGEYLNNYIITNRSASESSYRWRRMINKGLKSGRVLYVGESFDGGVLAVFLEQDLTQNEEAVRIFKLDAAGQNE